MSDHTAVLLAARARALTLQVATTDGDYSRASTATYVDASGIVQTAAIDEARTAHYVGATLTRLYEAAATNLALWSSAFDSVTWGKASAGAGSVPTVTANAGTAPDGTATADRIVFATPGAGDRSYVEQSSIATTAAASYTASWWVKADGAGDVGKILVFRSVAGSAYTSVTLTADWQRVSATEVASGTSSTMSLGLRPSFGSSSGTVTALVWGAQIEAGTAATSTIPTTSATVTRAADVGGLAATTTGYTRTVGSFLTDGFAVGMEVTPSGFTTTTPATITDVTATTMTVDLARTADLIAGGRTLAVGLPAVRAWENVEATPVTGQPWVEESYLPGAVEQVTVTATGMLEVLPLYTLTLRTKLGIGMTALLAYADAVLAHFAPGLALTLTDGTDLRVRTRPAPFATPIVRGDTWAACAVTIPLRHHTPNPR